MDTLSYLALHAHSGWRWIVLILLLVAIVKMYQGWKKKADYTDGARKLGLFTMVAYHIQFLGGLVLYFVSDKIAASPEFNKKMLMEHGSIMLIGMVLITIGYSKAKRATESEKKYKTQFIFYLITLILVLAAIPWPFRPDLAGSWF